MWEEMILVVLADNKPLPIAYDRQPYIILLILFKVLLVRLYLNW